MVAARAEWQRNTQVAPAPGQLILVNQHLV